MSIQVKATFPDEDEELKPSGSKVWWTKAHKKMVADGAHIRARWCVPVTCGGGCGTTRDVPILKGLSREGILSVDCLKRFPTGECAGYCRDCWSEHYRRDLHLPDQSKVFFSAWDAEGLPGICGKCKTTQVLECDRTIDFNEFTWACRSCGHIIGMAEHPSGAKLLWLDRKDAEDGLSSREKKVAFICAFCGLKHYVFPHNALLRTWRGRADACKRGAGDPKTITEDRVSERSGTITRFSQEVGGLIPVSYEKCPHR